MIVSASGLLAASPHPRRRRPHPPAAAGYARPAHRRLCHAHDLRSDSVRLLLVDVVHGADHKLGLDDGHGLNSVEGGSERAASWRAATASLSSTLHSLGAGGRAEPLQVGLRQAQRVFPRASRPCAPGPAEWETSGRAGWGAQA